MYSNLAAHQYKDEASLVLDSIEKDQEELAQFRNDLVEKLECMKETAISLENVRTNT